MDLSGDKPGLSNCGDFRAPYPQASKDRLLEILNNRKLKSHVMGSESLEKNLLTQVTPCCNELSIVVVERLACPNNPESYVGGSLAPDRFNQAEQVKG